MTTKTQYGVQYGCDNCGWSGALKFYIGKSAPDKSACPKCHCITARKQITLPFVPKRRPEPVQKDPVLIPIIPGAWPKNSKLWPGSPPRPCPRPHEPWVDPYWPRDPWDKPRRFWCDTRVDNGEARGARVGGLVMWDYD